MPIARLDRIPLLAAIGRIPPTVRGGLLFIAAGTCFAVMTAMIRPLAEELHPFQIVFFRNILGVAFLAPWLLRARINLLGSPQLKVHMLRAVLFVIAMMCWYSAIPHIALIDASALVFTAPIYVTILSAVVLRERVRLRRWTAVAIGFSGMLIVLRPGFEAIPLAAVLVLGDALAWSVMVILARFLARSEPASAIVGHMFVWASCISLIPALFVWQWPSLEACLWLLALSGVSTIGHVCVTRALTIAEASAVMPFEYTQLVTIGVIGYLAFGEVPDDWTLVGAAVIIAAAIYIGQREAAAGRRDARAAKAAAAAVED
ncbi:MAG: DMT family transporter [Proteobacteria bacterium]|nr:DMT family transporter [Pseudomonadota bacterium]